MRSQAIPAAAAGAGLLLIPAGVLIAPDVAELLFYLLALLGIAKLFDKEANADRNPHQRLVAALAVLFFATALLSTLASGSALAGLERLDRFAHFLAAPLLGLLMQRARISHDFLMLAVKLAALAAGAVAVVQLATGTVRAGGAVNPLLFGALSLLLGFFSLVRLPLETVRQKAFSLAAFVAGGTACALSQARGAWVAAALLPAVLVYFWWRARLLTKRLLLNMSVAFVALPMLSCTTALVQSRIDTTMAEYQTVRDHGPWDNSMALRVILWQSGLQAAKAQPLLGWGPHRTQQAAASKIAEPEIRHRVLQFTHLHNEYLNTLVGRGLPGLLSLVLLLLAPIVIFLRQAQRPELLVINSIGTLLCVGYAVSGMTNLAFGHDVMNIFFLTFLALTLPAAQRCTATLDTGVRFRRGEPCAYTARVLDFAIDNDRTNGSHTTTAGPHARRLVAHQSQGRRQQPGGGAGGNAGLAFPDQEARLSSQQAALEADIQATDGCHAGRHRPPALEPHRTSLAGRGDQRRSRQ